MCNTLSWVFSKLLEHSILQRWWKCLVIISAILVILFYLRSWLRAVRLAFSLYGPTALPLLGNIFMIRDGREFAKFGKSAYEKYGVLFRGWLTVVPIIIVLDPKHLQIILSNVKLTDKNFLYSFMHTFIGSGLITNNGHKWKAHRKYIQPYFHLQILEMFIHTFFEGAVDMVDQLRSEKEVNITPFVNRCILDILHDAILGIPIKEEVIKKQSPFRKGHVVLTERILRPWFLLDFVYKFTTSSKQDMEQQFTLQTFVKKILEQRLEDKKRGQISRWCLLEVFLGISETNPDFTDEDIANELCTFMLAGQDSVGAAISFSLYYLAKHEDIQEKVIKELEEVFKQSVSVNMESLNSLKYLEQCIKEAMRLCPSVPIIARKLSEDVKLGSYVLPEGANVFISPYATHRLPKYYPDPEKFDPERFSPNNQQNRNPYAYIPFSAGPRNCIGYKFALLEIKTIVATVLRNYMISVVPGYELDVSYRITLRAKGGIHLRFQPRSIA